MPVSYKPYDHIDKKRWDECVDNSHNNLIYARSLYLDNIADNWDGIVLNDYEAVMPLPWRKKFGIRYLYQPAFSQQGGIFSRDQLNENIINQFLQTAYARFRFAEITLNYSCLFNAVDHFSSVRNNYILNLNELAGGIPPKNRKAGYKLRSAEQKNLKYHNGDNIHEAIELYRKLYSERLSYFSDKDFNRFEKLCKEWETENVIIRKVSSQDGQVLAMALMLIYGKRIYNLVSCINPEGKKLLANYFLYNNIVKEFSGRDLLLDFEGSDVPGIAHFYRQLSGQPQPYPFIRWNNLPKLMKMIKR